MVQWWKLSASNAGGTGSIPGQGAEIPHAAWHNQKKKKKIKIIINQKYDGGCYEKSAEMLPLDCSPSIVFLQIFITSRE